MTPWFGLHLPSYTFPDSPPERLFDRIVEQARAAEGAGFSLVTVMDHLNQTRTVRLGTLVSGVTYRNPALLAKTATTLDVLSGGRAVFGLGAAWFEAEHVGLGFDFPPIRERMDRLDEALTIVRAMFREERPSFAGRFYRIEEALNVPRPIQPGGPRILVGGGGEQRTLKIAARHADITHWFPLGLEALQHKTEVLARHCGAIGRDPASIERTMATPVMVAATASDATAMLDRVPPERRPHVFAGTPEQAAEALRPYLDAGFTGFTFSNPMYGTPERIAVVGELLRLVGG
jgi:alkanesulfonate monooxygenase SsuD/methylene tetrahydromethanopterin reductase-like flavin-dependent oxidoreductase (luciferase family)